MPETSSGSCRRPELRTRGFFRRLQGVKFRVFQELQSDFQLFSFSNPGLVSFSIRGILSNNNLQIGLKAWIQAPALGLSRQLTLMQVSFGPFTSPEKRITLVNIIDHYRLVLSAMPFVSVDTRLKALKALQDFSASDVANANAGSTAVVGVWGPDMT